MHKKEYRKEFIEACLQKRDNECDLVATSNWYSEVMVKVNTNMPM